MSTEKDKRALDRSRLEERESAKESANPGDRSHDPEPHHALNNPADDPDDTEWPDPDEKRGD